VQRGQCAAWRDAKGSAVAEPTARGGRAVEVAIRAGDQRGGRRGTLWSREGVQDRDIAKAAEAHDGAQAVAPAPSRGRVKAPPGPSMTVLSEDPCGAPNEWTVVASARARFTPSASPSSTTASQIMHRRADDRGSCRDQSREDVSMSLSCCERRRRARSGVLDAVGAVAASQGAPGARLQPAQRWLPWRVLLHPRRVRMSATEKRRRDGSACAAASPYPVCGVQLGNVSLTDAAERSAGP